MRFPRRAAAGATRFGTCVFLCILALSACGSDSNEPTPPPPPVQTDPPATVALTSDAPSVALAKTVTLSWNSTGATSCSAGGGWTGAKAASGQQSIGPLRVTTTFDLTCTGAGTPAKSSVTVVVTQGEGPRAEAQLKATVRVLEPMHAGLLIEASDTGLTFNGPVPLAAGEVIVVGESAYRVAKAETINGQTIASVTAPSIEELFDKLEISGTFSLDPTTPAEDARGFGIQRFTLPSAPGARLQTQANTGASMPIDFGQPGVRIKGSAILGMEATPDINFDASRGGFQRSSFAISSSLSATMSVAIESDITLTVANKKLTAFRIPIPLTIVDSALRLVGVQLASIYVPIYLGAEVRSEFEYGLVATSAASSMARLDLSDQGALSGSFTYTAPTLGLSGLTAGPSPTAVALATEELTTFAYLSARPALAVLNTVALIGVDVRLGPAITSTLQFLPSSTPPYCLESGAGLRAEARGFVSAVGARKETDPENVTLFSTPSEKTGSCQNGPTSLTVSASPTSPIAFVPMQVNVTASASSGIVTASLDGTECTATLGSDGKGTCSLVPSRAGLRELRAAFGGNSSASPATATVQIDVLPAKTTLLLTTDAASQQGKSVPFKATLTAIPLGDPKPTGEISVYDEDSNLICAGVVDETGSMSCQATLTELGTRVYRAYYAGDDNYEESASPDWLHTVTEKATGVGSARVYATSLNCRLLTNLNKPACTRVTKTAPFDLSYAEATETQLGTLTRSASMKGGAALNGTITDGTYVGHLNAELVNGEAGGGWRESIAIGKLTDYQLSIKLNSTGNSLGRTCRGTIVAGFLRRFDVHDVEDIRKIDVSAPGCGSSTKSAEELTFTGVLVPGQYELYLQTLGWFIGDEGERLYTEGDLKTDGQVSLRIQAR